MTVRTILSHKGRDVVTIAPTATLSEAVKLLSERRIGAECALEALRGSGRSDELRALDPRDPAELGHELVCGRIVHAFAEVHDHAAATGARRGGPAIDVIHDHERDARDRERADRDGERPRGEARAIDEQSPGPAQRVQVSSSPNGCAPGIADSYWKSRVTRKCSVSS